MSFRRADNKFFAAVGAASVATTSLPAAGAVVTNVNLPAGAVVVTDLGLRRLDDSTSGADVTALANGEQFMIVQSLGASKPLLKSEVLTIGSIKVTGSKYVARQQQVTVIGYDGASGSLPSANDTSYFVKIRKNDNDAGNRSQPFSIFGQYGTGGAATVTDTAFGMAVNIVKNMSLEPANNYLSVEVLSDGTIAALPAPAQVTSGSTTVVCAAHVLNVGDFVNLAGATYQVKVVVDANTFALSTPYVGVTAAIANGTGLAQAGSITAITATGLRLTGIQADFDVNAFRDFYVNRFTATFSDDDTPIVHVQGAREGNGAWERAAMDEYMTWGYEGQNEMISTPPKPRESSVVGGAEYSMVSIEWTEDIQGLVTKAGGKGIVILYCELDGSSELPATLAAGEAADVLGELASPTFASTDLNA